MKEDILNLIRTGEGHYLEFKERFNSSIGKDICAFANTFGGKIILGVKDNGEIRGNKITNSHKSEIQSISRNMDPPLEIEIKEMDEVVIIEVPEGDKKPYSINGHFYYRVGATSQQLNRDEIREFFKSEGLVLFDEKPNESFDLKNDLDEYKFEMFLELAKITKNQNKKQTLKNLGLIKDNRLVNAGVLLFSHRVTEFFIQASVSCVLFEGDSRKNIIDKKDFDEDLISNYENAYNFILSKLNTKYIIKGKRKEELELPKEAIREALMNALIHRDYFSTGHIQVNIFIDRVEITSPGGLVRGLKEEDFGEISLPRNPLLFDLMSRTNYVEKAGTGIKRIEEAMKEYGLEVNFKNTGFFTVVLKREKINDGLKDGGKDGLKDGGRVTKNQKKILEKIKENPYITTEELSEHIDINKRNVEKNISKLQDKNIIKRIGPAKSGYWKILE